MIRPFLVPGMCCWRAVGLAVLVTAAISVPLISQQTTSGSAASTSVVTFTLDFPQSNPARYSVAVDATGHTRYECTGKMTEDAEEQEYRVEFEMSPGNRERIFEWTKQAQYFARKIDADNHKVAFTGTKILSYQDGQRSFSAKYNYSSLPAVQQLTALFQNMAVTLEYRQRLAYYHRYQKLALDEELKRMEEQGKNGELSEIQGVAPVLREIADDTSVLNGVRVRAKELIEMGNHPRTGR